MAYIYVVEDDNNISEIEGFALKNAGHTVIECASGKDFHKLTERVYKEDLYERTPHILDHAITLLFA